MKILVIPFITVFMTITNAMAQQEKINSDSQLVKNNEPSEELIRAIAELRKCNKIRDSIKKDETNFYKSLSKVPSYSIKDRRLVSIPINHLYAEEEGIVVVEIIVDKKGNVIKATPGLRGTTTTSPLLWEKAREMAMGLKFNETTETKEQTGTYSFVFAIE